jgi:hypothetical protein
LLRATAATAGAVVFVVGVIALFTTDNSAGSLFLITSGVVLFLGGLLGDRIRLESLELLGARIHVEDVVRGRLQLADSDAAAGDDAGIRAQALTLQKLGSLYDLYRYIRETQSYSDQRTRDLDQLAVQMQAAGREAEFDPADVSTWFHQGDDALRVVSLNLMLARTEYRDFLAVLKTVDAPRSNFEQYYGLKLASAMLPELDSLQKRLLTSAITRAQRTWRFRRDRSLMRLSTAVLGKLR